MKPNIYLIEEIEPDVDFSLEDEATAWLFKYLRHKYKWFCYKIEDAWISNKPFDSIIDVWNNERYFVEIKFDRHKKFDIKKLKETTLRQLEPMQMVTLISLKNIWSTVYVITYVKSKKKFLIFKY